MNWYISNVESMPSICANPGYNETRVYYERTKIVRESQTEEVSRCIISNMGEYIPILMTLGNLEWHPTVLNMARCENGVWRQSHLVSHFFGRYATKIGTNLINTGGRMHFMMVFTETGNEYIPLVAGVTKLADYLEWCRNRKQDHTSFLKDNLNKVEVWIDKKLTYPVRYGPVLGMAGFMKAFHYHIRKALIESGIRIVAKTPAEMYSLVFNEGPERTPSVEELLNVS